MLNKKKKLMSWDELFNKMAKQTIGNIGNTEAVTPVTPGQDINALIALFKPINPTYKEIYKNTTQRNALEYLVDNFTYEKIQNLLKQLPKLMEEPYSPQIYSPLTLKNKFAQLIAFCRKRGAEKTNNKYKAVSV